MSCTGCEHGGVLITQKEFDSGAPRWVDNCTDLRNEVEQQITPDQLLAQNEFSEVAAEAGYQVGYWATFIPFHSSGIFSTQKDPQAAYASGQGYGSQRNGWKFTPDAEPDIDAGDPTEVYILPMSLTKTAANGSCSSATAPDCTGGSPCTTAMSWFFEIWSVIRTQSADGMGKRKVTPVSPTGFTISDPNNATSGATFSAGNVDPSTYQQYIDPRGDFGGDADVFALRRQEAQLTFGLNPDACGEAAWWESNMRDWLVEITGYTLQTQREVAPGVFEDDPQHVEAGTFVIGAYCARCAGTLKIPGGGGGQGGGKNQNINSIGN